MRTFNRVQKEPKKNPWVLNGITQKKPNSKPTRHQTPNTKQLLQTVHSKHPRFLRVRARLPSPALSQLSMAFSQHCTKANSVAPEGGLNPCFRHSAPRCCWASAAASRADLELVQKSEALRDACKSLILKGFPLGKRSCAVTARSGRSRIQGVQGHPPFKRVNESLTWLNYWPLEKWECLQGPHEATQGRPHMGAHP